MRSSKDSFTQLLNAASTGNEAANKQLWTVMYEELQRIARAELLKERRNHTLTTAELVDEAYLRLVNHTRAQIRDRMHFRALAARAMREILVDHARRRNAQKRPAGRPHVPLDEALYRSEEQPENLVALNEALVRLERLNARLSKVVECLYFGGYTRAQVAEILGIAERTVDRDWAKAKSWLYQEMYGNFDQPSA